MNYLYYGDNLDILRKYIKDESIDLCYIDPPFNSQRNYNQIYNNIGEDKAQAQAFIDMWQWDKLAIEGFDQIVDNYHGRFTSQSIALLLGLREVLSEGSLLAYLVSMTSRIAEIYRVLKPTGAFYLHCDPTASHYLKLVLDAVFCPQGGIFTNEIIWHYKTFQGQTHRYFAKKHDTVFLYCKSKIFTYNEQFDTDFSDTVDSKRWAKYFNDKKQIVGANMPLQDSRFMRYLNKWIKQHKREPNTEDIIFEACGQPIDSVWHMKGLDPKSSERLGYPTQKPKTLLERIIKASSNEGDIILDAYCGCGTTVEVAQYLNRQWIGIDITYQSISLILKRLEDSLGGKVLSQIKLDGIPKDIKSAEALANRKDDRTRKEFEKWAILTYSNNRAIIQPKKGADKGVDGIVSFQGESDKTEKIVLQVKSGNIKPSDIRELQGTIMLERAALGVFITLKEPSKAMTKTAKEAGVYQNGFMSQSCERIQIVTIKEILEEKKRLNVRLSHSVLKSAAKRTVAVTTSVIPGMEIDLGM